MWRQEGQGENTIGIPLLMPDVLAKLEKMLPFKYFTELDWTAFRIKF